MGAESTERATLEEAAALRLRADRIEAEIARERDRAFVSAVHDTIDDRRISSIYQPIVDTIRGTVVGVEALSRFPLAHRPPQDWFSTAHELGRGTELELLAIESAIASSTALGDRYLAVNAAPETICDPRLLDLLGRARPTFIVIEMTASEDASSHDTLQHRVAALRELGIRIAVDDVGHDFGNFAHVVDIVPDIIKIDDSLINGVSTDSARRALVEAIVSLGARTGAQVVAEGVESQAELDTTAALGVGFAQGRFLAPPGHLPVPVIRNFARRPRMTLSGFAEFGGHRALERPFELALLHSPIGVAVVGLDGKFLHVNPILTEMLGYTARELHHMYFQEITHDDDLDADLTLLEECLSGERDHYRMEKHYVRSDGHTVSADLSVAVVRSQHDEPLYFISQIRELDAE